MKCTPIKLTSRKEYAKSKKASTISKNNVNVCSKFDSKVRITTDFYGYSFKLSKLNKPSKPLKPNEGPNLAITNLILPDNLRYNTGTSLDRWSKKRPRLRSGRKGNGTSSCSPFSEEYDITFDISNIINDEVEEKADVEEDNLDENVDVDSDIEKLILESQRSNDEECDKEVTDITRKTKRHRSSKTAETNDEKSKKKIKNKLKKTIRFSFSKPVSPETEQVIRVDVTSNMTVEELKHLELCKGTSHKDCSKGHSKMINDSRKESERGFNDNIVNFDGDDEDFIVRCRQLALTQKRR